MINLRIPVLALISAGATVLHGAPMPIETQQTNEKDHWDLTVLYAGEEQWQQARTALEARFGALDAERGHLGEGPARLLGALALASDLRREYQRLSSYARMKSDLDRRSASDQARAQQVDLTGTKLAAATSFLAPEILAIPEAKVQEWVKREPRLEVFSHDLDDILRQRPHTLAPAEERLLADSGMISSAPDDVYGVLATADLPWPEVTLSTGETVRLDQSAFSRVRTAPLREDRLKVFHTFFETWKAWSRTFGVLLDAEIKKNIFYARARKYPSALEAALDRNRVPVAVYDAMVRSAIEGLPALHRYLRLRARVLGVTDLGYHDVSAPLVPAGSRTYGIEEARRLVLESLAPLGSPYVEALRGGYASRWVDFWPSPGKRSGAYSNGSAYGEHPFILMNFTGKFDALATLAHESGHAMHSHLANGAQAFPKAGYSIFVAEVASTFNEALLYRHAIDHSKDDDERLALLSSWLDGVRGTFFRQAMFAEFERGATEAAEKGEGLTGERLSALYLDLLRKYMGTSAGACAVEDLYAVEWAYIPHFYANFYVFQYATGYAASTALARRVLAKEPGALDGYLEFLRAGGSDYPFALLKKAGVDLSKPEPYRATIAEMNRVLDEMEQVLARRK